MNNLLTRLVLAVALVLGACGGGQHGAGRLGGAGDGGRDGSSGGEAAADAGDAGDAGGHDSSGSGSSGAANGGEVGSLAGAGGSDGSEAGFTINVGPAGAALNRDSIGWVTVELLRDAGFDADVQVMLTNPPPGVWGDVVTFTGELDTEVFQLDLGPELAIGQLSVEFSATSGVASATAELALDVLTAEPSSQQKIEAARLASTIDLGTSLLYRCYAQHGDALLPNDFRGSGSEEDLMLQHQIEVATALLSADELAALRPYTLRPDHPESVYSAYSQAVLRRPGDLADETCVVSNWISERSPSIPLRVWINDCDPNSQATALALLARVLQVFEAFWPDMTTLMGDPILDAGGPDEGGDDAIDVYLVDGALTRGEGTPDLSTLGLNGLTRGSPPYPTNSSGQPTSSAYMMLPRFGLLSQEVRSTMTHEFFHVLQFAHHDTYKWAAGSTPHWFVDASATWASVYFDRELPWPARVGGHTHAKRFGRFQSSTLALNDAHDVPHQYAAYIWPLFMEQNAGTPFIIADTFTALEKATSAASADTQIDSQLSFATNFHNFALRNLNASFLPGDPLPLSKRYEKLDDLFPDQSPTPSKTRVSLYRDTYTDSLDLAPLSAAYYVFTPTEGGISKVELDVSGLQPQGSLDVDALVHTADGWVSSPLAFTGQGKVVFCFDKGPSTETIRGSFDAMELVLSNHAKAEDARLAGDLIVTASSKACSVWVGTTKATLTTTGASGTLSRTTTTSVTLELDAEAAMSSGLGEIPYKLRSGTYQFDSLFESVNRNPDCRTIDTASGVMYPALPTDFAPGASNANFTLFTDSQPATYFGSGFSWATVNGLSNCNDSNTDEASSGLAFLDWWQAPGGALQPDGVTASGANDSPDGMGGTVHYEWTLVKQDE